MPIYEGQRQKAVCPITRKSVRWIAKFNHKEDCIMWWCACGKTVGVEKAVASKKKTLL